eukprot:3356618-Amphidinium_carterae.1
MRSGIAQLHDAVRLGSLVIEGDCRSRACVCEQSSKLYEGWIDGFDYDTCCDPKHGPAGNSQCWDGLFNFDLCCFPREEL